MKTLYININGENIQSTKDIIVVGRPEDAIINKFYFELGKEILKGVVAPGATSIKKKDIVTDFKAHDEKSYYLIMEQWEILKQELLGENPSGTRTIKLPDEYISWLQNSSQPAYAEIAKALYKRGGCVEVSIDKIYKNAIGIIVNNIEPEECKGCGQFVVNEDAVTDDSAITASIQEIMPQISFVPFEDYGDPECGEKPCECKPEPPVCPKCGKYPCECEKTKEDCFVFITKLDNNTRESTCSIVNNKGIPIGYSQYWVISSSNCRSDGIVSGLLVVPKDEKEQNLYYVSKNGKLHIIGAYDVDSGYVEGRYYDTRYWEFAAFTFNNYILYRHNREYKLYEITDGEIREVCCFKTKKVLWSYTYTIGKYLVSSNTTIDIETGLEVKIGNYEHTCCIGMDEGSPIFIASNSDDWNMSNNARGGVVMNEKGERLWNFGYTSLEILPQGLLLASTSKYENVMNLKGNSLLAHRTKYGSFEVVDDNCLKVCDFKKYDDYYYIISSHHLVNGYESGIYLTKADYKLNFFSVDIDQLLLSVSWDDDNSDYEFVYTDKLLAGIIIRYLSKARLYSSSFQQIYEVKGDESILGYTSNTFAIAGLSYVEIYDWEGNLLKEINHKGNLDCSYDKDIVTFRDKMNGYIGYFDKEGKMHYVKISEIGSDYRNNSIINVISSDRFWISGDQDYLIDNNDIILWKGQIKRSIINRKILEIDGVNYLIEKDGLEPCTGFINALSGSKVLSDSNKCEACIVK